MPYYATNPEKIPVGPLQILVNRPAAVDLSDAYLTRVILQVWLGFGGSLAWDGLPEWKEIASTPEVYTDGKIRVGWNGHLAERLRQEFAGGATGEIDPVLAGTAGIIDGAPQDFGWSTEYGINEGKPAVAVPLYVKAQVGITPQLGLLEDDILYNLSLLAVNVLQPLKDRFPDIVVVSGFRQVNNGISQHERGEAVDLRLGNQTPERLYTVADYIAKTLPFDQLVLNYSVRPRQSWIHVSFSAQSLRYEVLTRDLDDTFHEGLYLIDELTGEDRAAALREQDEYLRLINQELQTFATRDARLNPKAAIGDQTTDTGDAGEEDGPPGVVPDKSGLVADVWNAGGGAAGWGFTEDDPGALEEPAYTSNSGRFVEAVVARLKGEADGDQWGWFKKPGGRNYNGRSSDGVAFLGSIGDASQPQANGGFVTFIDVIIDSDSTDAKPGWGPKSPSQGTDKFVP